MIWHLRRDFTPQSPDRATESLLVALKKPMKLPPRREIVVEA
jgi:hypothetical protein